jgi:hypothetical protein
VPDLNNIKDYEDVARGMIRHENELINNRMGWMTTLNGLLFTAIGFLWEKTDNRLVVIPICCLGFLICATSLASLHGATKEMSRIRKWWMVHKPIDYQGPGIMGGDSSENRGRLYWVSDLFGPWDLTALFLLIAWLVVFIISLCHRTQL